MPPSGNRFEIRLSLKDADVVKRGLEGLGADGQRALKRIEGAGKPASQALITLSEATAGFREGVQEAAGSAGRFGDVLQTFGTKGLAAAAGIGAVVVAFRSLNNLSTQLIEQFADVGDAAAKVGTSAENYQALKIAFETNASSAQALDQILLKLRESVGKALGGDQQVLSDFQRFGITLRDLQVNGDDTAKVFSLITENFDKAGTEAEAVAVGTRLASEGFRNSIPAVEALKIGVEALTQAYKDAGLVAREDVVKAYAALRDENTKLEALLKVALAEAVLPFATAMHGLKQAFIDTLVELKKNPQAIDDIIVAFTSLANFLREYGVPAIQFAADAMARLVNETSREIKLIDALLQLDLKRAFDLATTAPFQKPDSLEAREQLLLEQSRRGGTGDAASGSTSSGTVITLTNPASIVGGGGGGGGRTAAKPPTYTGYTGPALGSFRAAQEVGLDDPYAASAAQAAVERIREKNAENQLKLQEAITRARKAENEEAARGLDLDMERQEALIAVQSELSTVFTEVALGEKKAADIIPEIIEGIKKIIVQKLIELAITLAIQAASGGTAGSAAGPIAALLAGSAGSGGSAGSSGGYEFGGFTFAKGGIVQAFASGGVVDRPTTFPMANGTGLMGEAGPEAIAPLRRMPDGDLGIRGTAPVVNVTVNNQTDAEVGVEQRRNKDGELELILSVVEQRMASQASRPGTQLNRAIISTRNQTRPQ